MAACRDEDDDWDDAVDSGYGDDLETPDEEPTASCPYCRREIYEDSPRCPSCERYISEEDHASPSKPAWIIATALLCLGIAIWWAFSA